MKMYVYPHRGERRWSSILSALALGLGERLALVPLGQSGVYPSACGNLYSLRGNREKEIDSMKHPILSF